MTDSTEKIAIDLETMAAAAAHALLEVKAVSVYEERPFIYTTGWASPVYVDCRKLMSNPEARRIVMDHAAHLLRARLGGAIEAIAGTETAGIPFAAWIADRLDLPMVYVRKKPKGWGVHAQVEGDLPAGTRCVLVDDLTTDGLSKIHLARALRQTGARVAHVFVLFNYDIYPQSRDALARSDISLHALTTWRDIFALTKARNYFTIAQAKEIKAFLADPVAWSVAHGGAGKFPSLPFEPR